MQTAKIITRAVVLFAFVLVSPMFLRAQNNQFLTLTAEGLKDDKSVGLDKLRWKYHAGDDARWAAKDFDDGNWVRVKSNWSDEEDFAGVEWRGRAWFRLRVRVDEGLVNQPLALRVWQLGASEIYIDGELLHRFGKIEPDRDEEYNPRGLFVPVVFTQAGDHTIAVRYSFLAAKDLTEGRGRWLVRGNHAPGFSLSFASAPDAASRLYERARSDRLEYVFIGLLLALALVHFLLFVFYRRAPGNLFYSFFAAGLCLVVWLSRLMNTGDFSAIATVLTDIVRNDMQGLAVLSLLAFLYVEFVGRVSWFFWLLLAFWFVGFVLHLTQLVPVGSPFITPALLVAALADCLHIMVRALKDRRAGAWIIAAGIGVFFVCVANNIAIGNNLIEVPEWLQKININITILSIPVAVSLYLARNFARTNRHLAEQLAQVQELSAQQLEHERTEAELRLQNEKEKSENERRAKELEEARQLQLSMLPSNLPQLPNLEIAAYMKTATEVGGDYYDFHVAEDGTLTAAIGDATGHGLKAGTVVTATKGLFNAFASEPGIVHFLKQTSLTLKRMNMRSLYMALALVKFKDNQLSIGGAGMPAALLFRAATGEVETIALKGAPLGSITSYLYREQQFDLSAGDTLLLMSDGYPEMFNPQNEMFEDGRAKKAFAEAAHEQAEAIINHLVEAGGRWAGSRPLDDDVTFLVLKVKG